MLGKRILLAREINHLLAYGMYPLEIEKYGEMPVEYVTGFAEFLDLMFVVNEDVLIPRIETEILVEVAIGWVKKLNNENRGKKIKMFDVGTGSGCVGVSVFKRLESVVSGLEVEMSDVSDEALAVAQINVKRLVNKDSVDRLQIVKRNLFSDFSGNVEVDMVAANLPYIPTERFKELAGSVKEFEPKLALDGGESGLEKINAMLEQIEQIGLAPRVILLEVDSEMEMKELYGLGGYTSSVIKDQFEKKRIVEFVKN